MAGGEQEQKKNAQGKGFAGLSSLVSSLPEVDTATPAASTQAAASAPQSVQPQPSPGQAYQEPVQPPSGGLSGRIWLLGIAIAIGVIWLISQNDTSTTSPVPSYSPSAQTTTPDYPLPPVEAPAPAPILFRPEESRPPVGQELVLSMAQIRYCLAEDIRMAGASSALDNYIKSDVNRFNTMVADYNSRCGNFRYHRGNLEIAQRDIEPYRAQFQSEGRRRFSRPPSGSLLAPDALHPAAGVRVQPA